MSKSSIKTRPSYQLNTDGGIDAKPGQSAGEASIGVVLRTPDGSLVHEMWDRIGWVADHHVAEYEALIAGLQLARGHGVDRLIVRTDSQVVVNQLNGSGRMRAAHLEPLWVRAVCLRTEFSEIDISWVSRKETKEADALADRALQPRKWGSKGKGA